MTLRSKNDPIWWEFTLIHVECQIGAQIRNYAIHQPYQQSGNNLSSEHTYIYNTQVDEYKRSLLS